MPGEEAMPERAMSEPSPCPNAKNHSQSPELYLDWMSWAEKMSKTHKQVRCPGCGLFKMWVPKAKRKKRGGQ